MRYIIIIFMFLMLSCFNKKNELCTQNFLFDIPFTVSPQQDTFKIGDTIWVEGILPNMFEDLNNNENIDISDFDFKTRIGVYPFTTSEFNLADFSFDYINVKGEFQHNTSGAILVTKLIYGKEENQKAFKVGMIPIETGGFYISFYNLTEDLYNQSLTDTDCRQNIEINYKMNDGDNNYQFIEEGPIDNFTKEGFDKDGGYAFWVVE